MSGTIKVKFKFKGYDADGEPIILDNNNNRILENPNPPELKDENLVMEVFSWNPTCIRIGRKVYCF